VIHRDEAPSAVLNDDIETARKRGGVACRDRRCGGAFSVQRGSSGCRAQFDLSVLMLPSRRGGPIRPRAQPGSLRMTSARLRHAVFNAETGEGVGYCGERQAIPSDDF
jgi:hypothetical protein